MGIMDFKKKLRVLFTAVVILIGGYCIQKYSANANFSGLADNAKADVPYTQGTYK